MRIRPFQLKITSAEQTHLFVYHQVVYADEDEWWRAQWSHAGRMLLEEIERTRGKEGLDSFKLELCGEVRRMKLAGGIQSRWPALYTRARKPKARLD